MKKLGYLVIPAIVAGGLLAATAAVWLAVYNHQRHEQELDRIGMQILVDRASR